MDRFDLRINDEQRKILMWALQNHPDARRCEKVEALYNDLHNALPVEDDQLNLNDFAS